MAPRVRARAKEAAVDRKLRNTPGGPTLTRTSGAFSRMPVNTRGSMALRVTTTLW